MTLNEFLADLGIHGVEHYASDQSIRFVLPGTRGYFDPQRVQAAVAYTGESVLMVTLVRPEPTVPA